MVAFLLAFLPSQIPGISNGIIGPQASQQAWDLYLRCRMMGWSMLGLFMLVAFLVHVAGIAQDHWHKIILRSVIAAALLSFFPTIVMPLVFGTGSFVATRIFSSENSVELSREFGEAAAEKQREPELSEQNPAPKTWVRRLAKLMKDLTPQRAMTEVILAVISVGFFVIVGFIAALWRCLVILLFVTSPLLIVMAVLPGIGKRIGGAWIAALIQLSFWQIMTGIFAFLVANTDKFLNPEDVSRDFAAVFFALAYTVMYLALPFVVNWILPISEVSEATISAALSSAKFASGMASQAVAAGSRVLSRTQSEVPKRFQVQGFRPGR